MAEKMAGTTKTALAGIPEESDRTEGATAMHKPVVHPTAESQQITAEMLHVLRAKNQEVNQTKDLLTNCMKDWVKDMLDKVEIVKNEVALTRDLVLPTCAVLDKLKGKFDELDEINILVQDILEKVEYMVTQIPVATNIIGIVMEQVDALKQEAPKTTNRDLTEVLEFKERAESSDSSEDPRTLENSPAASSSDLESSPEEQLEGTAARDYLRKGEGKEEEIAMQEQQGGEEENPRDNSRDITLEILTVMKSKNNEINDIKDLLTNVMKYWVRDLLQKMEIVTMEATDSRNLVFHTCDALDKIRGRTEDANELKDLVNDLFGKVEYMMNQVTVATNVVETVIDQICNLQGAKDFRNELLTERGNGDKSEFNGNSHTNSTAGNPPLNGSKKNLEAAGMERLDLKDDKDHLDAKEKKEEVKNESCVTEEHMRGDLSAYEDEIKDESYLFEEEKNNESVSYEAIEDDPLPADKIGEYAYSLAMMEMGSGSSTEEEADEEFIMEEEAETEEFSNESDLEDTFGIEEEETNEEPQARESRRYREHLDWALRGCELTYRVIAIHQTLRDRSF